MACPPGTAPTCMESGGHMGLSLSMRILAKTFCKVSSKRMGLAAEPDLAWLTLGMRQTIPPVMSSGKSPWTNMLLRICRRRALPSSDWARANSSSLEMPVGPEVFLSFRLARVVVSSDSWIGGGGWYLSDWHGFWRGVRGILGSSLQQVCLQRPGWSESESQRQLSLCHHKLQSRSSSWVCVWLSPEGRRYWTDHRRLPMSGCQWPSAVLRPGVLGMIWREREARSVVSMVRLRNVQRVFQGWWVHVLLTGKFVLWVFGYLTNAVPGPGRREGG